MPVENARPAPAAAPRGTEFNDRLGRVSGRIRDSFSLCNFMGKTEREVLVAQTIKAAVNNLATRGEPFSFRGDGVHSVSGNGLFDNRSAYSWLLREGYFVEESREGRVVIFPTDRLLTALEAFFTEGRPAAR